MSRADEVAIECILDVIEKCYGYDFHGYVQASLKRRLIYHQNRKFLQSLADILPKLINEPEYFQELLSDLSIMTTEFFRDPEFYAYFQINVFKELTNKPTFTLWHAGCSSGEEVYSMAIMLHEAKLLPKAKVYATDFNPQAIHIASKAVYSDKKLALALKHYHHIPHTMPLERYFIRKYDFLKVKHFLKKPIQFSQHNLVNDDFFCSVDVIICRNVLIYFNEKLKQKILRLFYESLMTDGFLCLGEKEEVTHNGFRCIDRHNSIYQKISS